MYNAEYHHKWYLEHREEQLSKAKIRREGRIEEFLETEKEYRRTHKIQRKDILLRYRYQVSQEWLDCKMKEQDGKCAICLQLFKETPHVDHCHGTKEPRGLLCRTCNAGIGLLRDSLQIVELAAQYLRKFEVNTNV